VTTLSYPNRNAERRAMVKERYSVAFPSDESGVPFALKVWHKSPEFMRLVVREDAVPSLRSLKVGKKLRMNYYASDLARPSERLETEVVDVKINREERVRGQYFVDLQILKSYH
jgi:hypothetical protein